MVDVGERERMRGLGAHRAVRVDDDGWPICLFCGRVRSTDHTGTIWLKRGDRHILPDEGTSQNEQTEAVRKIAQPVEPSKPADTGTGPVPLETYQNHTIEHNWEKHHTLRPGDIFVEVGGFWGKYGVKAARQGATAFLVEPFPSNIATLEMAMKVDNVKFGIVRKAVGDHRGTEKFVCQGNPAGCRLAVPGEDLSRLEVVDVEVDTLEGILDGLGVDHVDLLGSDCEGAEIDLVKYAGKWVDERRIRNFAIGAYHSPQNPRILTEMLAAKGYVDISWEDISVLYARAP
jgi:FkbM family methyltransferase